MYTFIDYSKVPLFDWGLHIQNYDMVEVLRPILFFCRGQKITTTKLSEYFTRQAIVKLEGDGFIKFYNEDK